MAQSPCHIEVSVLTARRFKVALIVLTLMLFMGCGEGGSVAVGGPLGPAPGGSGGGSGGSGPGPEPQSEPAFSGKVVLLPVLFVEERGRADALAQRALIETDGRRLLGDGAFIVLPEESAEGWTATLGSQTVTVGADGLFAFNPPADGATEVVFRHPSEDSLQFTMTVQQLGLLLQTGQSVSLPTLFNPCGMASPGEDLICGVPAQPRRNKNVKARGIPVDPASVRPVPESALQVERDMIVDPMGLGTAPDLTKGYSTCITNDGIYLNKQQSDFLFIAQYIGSTCHQLVRAGRCLNENLMSDTEYQLLYDKIGDPVALQALAEVKPGQGRISCGFNHKGRHCGMFSVGDVAVKIPGGAIVKPTGEAEATGVVEVKKGQNVFLTVHNNGTYGKTIVTKTKNEIRGTLEGEESGLFDHEGELQIRHFQDENKGLDPHKNADGTYPTILYKVNRSVQFKPSADAQIGQEDTYRFVVDDRSVSITFKMVEAQPFTQLLGKADEVTVLDVNASGLVALSRADGTYLEPEGQALDELQLLPVPGEALLNDEGSCLYQAADHQSAASIRVASGESKELPPPVGSTAEFAQGLVALSPKGLVFLRGDGGRVYTFTGVLTEYLADEATGVTWLQNTCADAMFGTLPGQATQDPDPFAPLSELGRLVKFNFDPPGFETEIKNPSETRLPGNGARYVDANSKSVLYTEFGLDFAAMKPAGITWAQFHLVQVMTGGTFDRIQESRIVGPGARVVQTSATTTPPGTGEVHTVVALNEENEVVGTISLNNDPRPVLWKNDGSVQDLLLSPPGTWRPLKMAGRYIVLEHTAPITGERSLYLHFRGQ